MDNEIRFYSDRRVKQHVIKKHNQLIVSFGKSVDEHFKGDIESYMKCRQLFAVLKSKASKGKGKLLADEEAAKLAKLNKLFRKIGELPDSIFSFVVKVDGKSTRVPKAVLRSMLTQLDGFKFISHGRHTSKRADEHWSSFFMPKTSKARELYAKYRRLDSDQETDMTKADKEKLEQECAEGKHAFPADVLIKDQQKKERRETKRLMNISKKAYVELQSKIHQLEAEVAQLKAENEHLKQLKDLNSDIEEEDFKPCSPEEFNRRLAEFEAAVKQNADKLPDECRSSNAACIHPENDIPEDESQQADESKILTAEKLQQMVDKHIVSKNFAQSKWKMMSGKTINFKEHKHGWTAYDTSRHAKTLSKICQMIVDCHAYYHLSAEDIAQLQKEIRMYNEK